MSAKLVGALEVVIPPNVASALLSPLMLVEAIVSAFATTGRDLLMPALLLVAVILWTEGRRRRWHRIVKWLLPTRSGR